MQFKLTPILATALALFTISANAAPLDVWDPAIISPTTGTVWTVGERVNVTWSLDDEPALISNAGGVMLAKGGLIKTKLGYLTDPIHFDLRTGFAELTVPDVPEAEDYEIILFGDSGNISKDFSIVAA